MSDVNDFLYNPLPEGLQEELRGAGMSIAWTQVGSRASVSPPPTDTDEDVLLLVTGGDGMDFNFVQALLIERFEFFPDVANKYDSDKFRSFRRGELNLLVTDDIGWYSRFMLATHVCRQLNLKDREDRIMVCKAVRDGEEYYPIKGLL